jgi:outer membrane protein assembly factor BamB
MRQIVGFMLVALASCGAHVEGVVFVDQNADGIREDNEPGAAGVVVAHERDAFVVADADGHYELDASAGGMIWVRVPDGFRPGPVWRPAADVVDIPIVPLTEDEKAAPFTFVMASDSHTTDRPDNPDDPWDGGDLAAAIEQATDLEVAPRFFTILGDITQGASPTSFERVRAGLARTEVPWVPVPGNHDWYDGGNAYRDAFGIDGYSFDIQSVHFIVWNTEIPADEQLEFVAADLEHVDLAAMKVAILGHKSPPDSVVEQFAALGVDYMFTGHWHANRRAERFGITEWGTQNFIMAGLDDSPAGYRIVTFTAGVPTMVHRERMVAPHVDLTAPLAGTCASPGGFPIVAAASLSAGVPRVRARIDCGTPFDLAPSGGWTYTGAAPALSPGPHSIDVIAESPGGTQVVRQIAVEVCTDDSAPPPSSWVTVPWPQVGGGPAHHNAIADAIAPPLVSRWATTIGGSPALGTPVVDADTVVISIVDRGAGDAGGAVALDLRTGAVKWRVTTPSPIVNAPAIADGIVVLAMNQGQILAVDLATGAARWQVDLADGVDGIESAMWGAPTIADGVVYAGVQGNFAALELTTGNVMWSHDPNPQYPWLGTRAAPAVADGVVIAPFNRTVGMFGWSAADGAQRWLVSTGTATAVNASPIVVDDVAYVINSSSDLTAIDVATGAPRWSRRINDAGFDWGYSATATPAYADGTLYIATKFRDLIALDTTTRIERWRATSPSSPVNFTHYRSNEPGFVASPIVTGDLVWIGRPDGRLLALSAADGTEVWSTQLGAPIVTTPAPAGEVLVVATYDGTVRALTAGAEREPGAVAACEPWVDPVPPPPDDDDDGGGCSSSTSRPELLVLLALMAWLSIRRRSARITER